jgi:endonuclease III
VGSIASALPSVIATDYTGIMARKTIPRGGASRQPKRRSSGSGAAPAPAKARRPAPSLPPAALTTWTSDEVEEAFRRFHAANPEPRGELAHKDPFTLLIAVVLSAQATDAGVNKATPKLFAVADTPEKMAALGEARLREWIKTIGLYRTKAKNIIALSRALIAEHGGKVPHDREALEALPGVGRKTANVVLNGAFGEPVIAVDTHVFRVANRTGLAPGKTPFEVEQSLERVVPQIYKRHAHHWLILHGRYVCKALKPACGRCLINDLCRWPDKNLLSV